MATLGYYFLKTSTLALSIYTVQVCKGEYLFVVDNVMRRTDTSYQFIGRMYVVVGIQLG